MNDLESTSQRGEIVWIDFSPTLGNDQAGHRPALVISLASFNKTTGRAPFVPITTRDRGWPFQVALAPGEPVTGVAMVDQATLMDWRARRLKSAGYGIDLLLFSVRRMLAKIAGLS